MAHLKDSAFLPLYSGKDLPKRMPLTHWGRVTHICVSKFTIIGSDNGLAPGRRQAIIWTNDIILLIIPLGTNFNEILIRNQTFSIKKMHLKMSSAKWRPFCLGLNVLTHLPLVLHICVSELGQHWRRRDAEETPPKRRRSHYLKQCWFIVNWTLRNKLQGNSNQNTKIFIHEKTLGGVMS